MRSLLVAAQPSGQEEILSDGLTAADWGRAGLILLGAIVLAQAAKALLQRGIRRGGSEAGPAELVGRIVGYVLVVAGLVYSLASLDVRIAPLLGALGIGGIALAFALRDILENLLAGILLQARRPFRRGDQITTNDHEGTVEDVNLRVVVLHTFDGERVYVPNRSVLREPIVNHTRLGGRRTTLEVAIAFGADLVHAKKVILAAVEGVEGVRSEPPPEAYVQEFADSAVTMAVRFWHDPDIAVLWRVRDAVAIAAKAALEEAGIEIPFPQRALWFRQAE
ncbi:MAG: mechanosensitive ion channel family protein [Actinomycetota bacterium]|nr:mechanosensitive ion channel family protein [Actinomycetota bacterium]